MKKSLFLLALFFVFANNAKAQETIQSTEKKLDNPVVVHVIVNNNATAQGNTQTTTHTINQENTQTVNQENTQTATARPVSIPAKKPVVVDLKGADTLYGNYIDSPYKANFQVEMLRHNAWGSLVPRKKIYGDPAKGTYPVRYRVAKKRVEQNIPKTEKSASVETTAPNTGEKNTVNTASSQTVSATQNSMYEPIKENTQDNSIEQKVEQIQESLLVPSINK